jgi:hypothetical protein
MVSLKLQTYSCRIQYTHPPTHPHMYIYIYLTLYAEVNTNVEVKHHESLQKMSVIVASPCPILQGNKTKKTQEGVVKHGKQEQSKKRRLPHMCVQ